MKDERVCHCTSGVMWSCPTSRCRSVADRCSHAARWSPRKARWRCPSQTAADAVSVHYWSAPPHPRTTGSQYAHHDNLTTTRTEFKYTTTTIFHFFSIEASLTALKITDPLIHSLKCRELHDENIKYIKYNSFNVLKWQCKIVRKRILIQYILVSFNIWILLVWP